MNNASHIIPIGTIIPSILSEDQFTAQTNSNWVLCDGRNVEGSDYHSTTSNSNIPDLRSMFLRGKNNGRNDGNENPNGEINLGTESNYSTALPVDNDFISNTTGNHRHFLNSDDNESGSGGKYRGMSYNGSNNSQSSTDGNHSHSITGGGDDETRPKNACVNYFIKINNSQANIKVWK